MAPADINPRTADSDSPTSPRIRLVQGEFARIWLAEVPKVVARHEEERRTLRQCLGLPWVGRS